MLADGTVVKLNTRVEPDRKAEMEDRLAKIAALRKIGWDREEKARADYLKRREREKAEELVEEVVKVKIEEPELADEAKDPKEGPKADPGEEDDPRPTTSELNSDEVKERRLTRRMKLKEINDKYAVIRSYGGKCAIVVIAQSKGDPDKKVFEFQPKEAFDQWMANEFIPSLKKQNEKDAVAPWWFRHPRRREYDAAIFKPLAQRVITTSDHLKNIEYVPWMGS